MTGSGPKSAALVSAFAAVYLIWGSTYLAIRVAVETIPPFMMLAGRFLFAGVVLFAWLRLRGAPSPTLREWWACTVTGAMMLCVGTGLVAVAEQTIPSGLAALLVATTSLWMVLLGWLWKKGPRPHGFIFVGIAIGLVGVFLLFETRSLSGDHGGSPIPGLMVVLGAFSWSVASVHGKDSSLPSNPFLTSAMQMTGGGVALLLASILTGEWGPFDWTAVSERSMWALLFLIVFGSFVAFSAFVWLLRVTTPARVSTYAFVNPAVAVVLGWLILAEPLNLRIFGSLALLTVSVVLVVRYGK